MPRPGFGIDDLLHPKKREYQPDNHDGRRLKGARPSLFGIGAKEAQKIFADLALTVPVDLEKVCRFLAVQVVQMPLLDGAPPEALGVYRGHGVIHLRAGLPETVRRLTLAHELGHHVLRHDVRSKWDSGESLISAHDPHEAEAWDFAGELLMPHRVLREKLRANTTVNDLTVVFGVSREAVFVQMRKRRLV